MLKRTYNRKLAESIPWNLLLLTVGASLQALCLQCISPQHEFLATGLMGVSLLANYLSGDISVSAWYFMFSMPFYVVGWFFVSRRFLFYTLYGTFMTTLAGMFYNHMGYVIPVTNELYAAVLGGVLLGTGGGIMLRSLGSGGGLDIISVILRNKWNIQIGQFMLFFNAVVFTIGVVLGYNLDNVMASIIMIFISSSLLDYVLGVFNHRKMVIIISDRGEEMAEVIMASEPFGITLLRGKGAYLGNNKEILLTVTNNMVLKRLETIVFGVDPHSLFIVENTFYVAGGQFRRG